MEHVKESKALTLEEEIVYWRKQAQESKTNAWLIALGIYYGLLIAKAKQ